MAEDTQEIMMVMMLKMPVSFLLYEKSFVMIIREMTVTRKPGLFASDQDESLLMLVTIEKGVTNKQQI